MQLYISSCEPMGFRAHGPVKVNAVKLLDVFNGEQSEKHLWILRTWQEDEWEGLRNRTRHRSPGGERLVMWDVLLPAHTSPTCSETIKYLPHRRNI